MNRRDFLARSGQLTLGIGALALLPGKTARAQANADVKNAELVTVTQQSAVLTWESENPTEGIVSYGLSENGLDYQVVDPAGPTRFHRVEIQGLEPGQTVFYDIQANGESAEPNEYSPGSFTTLTPPKGTHLFTFATITDMHVGLMSAGAVGGISSFVPVECPLDDPTCWQVGNQAVIDAINKTASDFTLVKGDLSHEYQQGQFEQARSFLEQLKSPYYVVRGNHDRIGDQPEDYFKKVFGLEATHYAFSHKGVRFVVLDSSNLETGIQEVSQEQWVWLEQQIETLGDEKLILVLHHAVTEEASIIFTLFTEDQQRLFSMLKYENNLIGILSGHSHRNIVTHQPELDEVPCIETSSTVHYPGGYNLYHVYTGGFMQTYHKIGGNDWRIWEEAGRAMYKGDAQKILFGSLADRNFSYRFKKSIPEPEPDETGTGCGCQTASDSGSLALGAAALAAGKLIGGSS